MSAGFTDEANFWKSLLIRNVTTNSKNKKHFIAQTSTTAQTAYLIYLVDYINFLWCNLTRSGYWLTCWFYTYKATKLNQQKAAAVVVVVVVVYIFVHVIGCCYHGQHSSQPQQRSSRPSSHGGNVNNHSWRFNFIKGFPRAHVSVQRTVSVVHAAERRRNWWIEAVAASVAAFTGKWTHKTTSCGFVMTLVSLWTSMFWW